MELFEAQNNVRDWARDINRDGYAAEAPRMDEFIMSVVLVLDDLLETVKKLDDEYNK